MASVGEDERKVVLVGARDEGGGGWVRERVIAGVGVDEGGAVVVGGGGGGGERVRQRVTAVVGVCERGEMTLAVAAGCVGGGRVSV